MKVTPFHRLKGPLHISHRGGALLYPENTLLAFQRAVQVHQTQVLELDVHLTRDAEVVVAHDPTLERCTDATGSIAAMTWKELQGVDAGFQFTPDGGATHPWRGQRIGLPRLVDVLRAFPRMVMNVEIKVGEAIEPVVNLLRKEPNLGRLCLGCDSDALAQTLSRQLPDLCLFYPRDALTAFLMSLKTGEEVVDDPRYQVLDMPWEWEGMVLFDEALRAEAAKRGKFINVWTVNDTPTMKAALQAGVGGIMTDRPDLLSEAIKEFRATDPSRAPSA